MWLCVCFFLLLHTVLNISTSAQLTHAMPADFKPPDSPQPASSISYFPYFEGAYLAVAASLNGGNVLATFVEMLAAWMKDLGVFFCLVIVVQESGNTCWSTVFVVPLCDRYHTKSAPYYHNCIQIILALWEEVHISGPVNGLYIHI